MNENEKLERELKAFRPQEPSSDFERRVEEALGVSARLAVRQLPEPGDEPVAQPVPAARDNLYFIPSLVLLGAAALVVLFFSFPLSKSGTAPVIPTEMIDLPAPPVAQSSLPVTDESPINGVSIEELSAMSESGWEQPQAREFLIDFFDEGIVERPGVNPARQYRYHFIDETIWVNPETNTIIRSSVPREETLLIGLEPF